MNYNKCWIFGDNISTDEIISTRFMSLKSEAELGEHLFEDSRPDFVKKITTGDIIVGGNNFGYGSSREHAVMALKGAGIRVVVARSFARIFFRNCINLGIAPIECGEFITDVQDEDSVYLDIAEHFIRNIRTERIYHFSPFPEHIQKYLKQGGLINALNAEAGS